MTNEKPSIFKNAALIGGGALGIAAFTLGTAGIAGAQDAPEDDAPVEETEETSSRSERRQAVIDAAVQRAAEILRIEAQLADVEYRGRGEFRA